MFRRTRLMAVLVLLLVIAVFVVTPILAGGGHGDTGEMTDSISSEGHTGLSLFLIDLYNNNRLVYALLVTAVMATLGMIVGQVTEIIIRIARMRRR